MAEIDTDSQEFKDALQAKFDEEAAGLKSALDKERDNRKKLERQLKGFSDVDPEEYKKLKEEAEATAEKAAKQAGDWEKREAQLKAQHEEIQKKHADRNQVLESALHKEMLDSKAIRAISEEGGIAELLLPVVRSSAKVLENEGSFRTVVLDEHGNPRLAKEAKTATDYMDLKEYVQSLKDVPAYQGAFKGTNMSGGGSVSTKGGGSTTAKTVEPDPDVIGRNLEDIAKGKATVQMPGT